MKVMKYIGLALLPMIFTACQDDALVKDQAESIYSLKATLEDSAPMSRAQVVLGDTSTTAEKFHWNAEDKMMILDVSNLEDISKHLFTINDSYDGVSTSADFTTYKPLTKGNPIVAIYPTTFSLDDTYGYFIYMDVAGHWLADNSEASWIKYFSENMFMMATGTASEDMGLKMQHLCSLIRVTYTNATESDVQIRSITLNGDICTNRTFQAGDTSYDAGHGGTSDHGIRFTNPVTVGAGQTENFYILTFAYFDHENNNWGGLTGFNFSYAEKSDASTPTTYNGLEFVVSDLKAGSSYWFNITETADGLVWTKDANQGEEEDVTVTFSNKEFSKALYDYLGANKVTLNADSCAVMTEENVLAVTNLDFDDQKYTISSLSGIENFVNLQSLICSYMGLEECDFSQNKSLGYARIQGNNLTSLDFSNCPELHTLICSYMNNLNSLNLAGCTKLSNLQAQSTGLTTLEIPNPEAMTNFLMPFSTSVDLSGFTNLNNLGVMGLNLTNLDFIPDGIKAKLTSLMCGSNQLTTLDLSKFPNLTYLACDHNKLTKLDLSYVPNMVEIACYRNHIATLDITSLAKLNALYCGNQYVDDSEGGDLPLELTLTSAQKSLWETTWSQYGESSRNVNLNEVTTEGNAGGGIATNE